MKLNGPGAHIEWIVEIDFGRLMRVSGHEDNATLLRLPQMRQQQLRQQKRRQIVDLAVRLEAIGGGQTRVAEHHARIVDQHIDSLEFSHQLPGKTMDALQRAQIQLTCLDKVTFRRIRAVARQDGCVAAQFAFDNGRGTLAGRHIATRQDNAAATCPKRFGNLEADAAVPASNYDNLLLDLIIVGTALAAHYGSAMRAKRIISVGDEGERWDGVGAGSGVVLHGRGSWPV